jgi:hypothetical protein
MRIGARERAVKHFSIQRMVEEYATVFERLDEEIDQEKNGCKSP